MRAICVLLLVSGLAVFACGCKKRANTTDGAEQKEKDSQPVVPLGKVTGKRGTFTIGKSTTFVTGPITSTGHIDYAAALNERLSKGVTAENNANVAIWKVLGPNPVSDAKVPPGYFEKLGMSPPPATGDYFIGLKQYAEQKGGNAQAATEALAKFSFSPQPWKSEDDPILSGWLRANEKPLTALREAVKKTHYYNPLIPEMGNKPLKGLDGAPALGAMVLRELAEAFATRAMLFVGRNQSAEAWQDLLVCHRLARLAGRGGSLLEGLVGLAIEQVACRGDIAFLEGAKPDAKTLQSCLKDLRALPPLTDLAVQIDAERLICLDSVMQLDLQGVEFLSGLDDETSGRHLLVKLMADKVDWNPMLEMGNKWFDRLVGTTRAQTCSERVQQLNQLTAELEALKQKVSNPSWLKKILSDGDAKAKAEAIGEVAVAYCFFSFPKVVEACDRVTQAHENVITAFALAWYQRTTGRYPDKLADLAPTYLTHTPKDLFTGKDLVYRPKADGFVLYSVGPNGRDDGGQGFTDEPPGDDIVVRIPQFAKP